MSRLVNVDELMEQINSLCSDNNENWVGNDDRSLVDHSEVVDIISNAPIVDAIPVVHGRWIDMGDFQSCSVCKTARLKVVETYYGKAERLWVKTFFCPDCGAKMDVEID